jgi:hypothetical protein
MSSETSTDPGFSVGHFFVLLSLFAASVAVVMVRPAAPENLILISLTIGAAGGAAVCFYRMLAPLMAPHADMEQQPLGERLRADLEREKALTLRSIKELEFDRAMGKLSPEDFDQMAGRLRARAMGIMRQLDAGSSVYRAVIEKELAARLGGQAADSRTRDLKAAPTGQSLRCACGVASDPDARFCKSCGARLATT